MVNAEFLSKYISLELGLYKLLLILNNKAKISPIVKTLTILLNIKNPFAFGKRIIDKLFINYTSKYSKIPTSLISVKTLKVSGKSGAE